MRAHVRGGRKVFTLKEKQLFTFWCNGSASLLLKINNLVLITALVTCRQDTVLMLCDITLELVEQFESFALFFDARMPEYF